MMDPEHHDPERRLGVTASEVARWMARHEQASDRMHRDLTALIGRLDDRQDRADDRIDALATRVAIVFAVVAVLWSIVVVLAPYLRDILNLPGS